VAVCQLSLHPYISLQFSQLGVLSPEGMCKVFDNDGKHTSAVISSVLLLSLETSYLLLMSGTSYSLAIEM
jgi:acyl transferase domain-containing protein